MKFNLIDKILSIIRPKKAEKKFNAQIPLHHSKKSHTSVKKITHNPIITPKKENSWESWQTFNPAAILINNKVHFLYRAIGSDGISRFGYANSKNGFELDERQSEPAYQEMGICQEYVCYSLASGGSWGGCEDPRMVLVNGDDKIYIIYTSCNGGLRVGLSSIN